MPTQKTLRDIIEELFGEAVMFGEPRPHEKKEIIDQTISEIKSLFKSKLPEKRRTKMTEDEIGNIHLIHNQGYNQALTEIKQIIEEI